MLTKDAVLRDADNPVLGNPQGDITIVEYFDYQCPYCKKVAPELAKVVKDDGKIRLVPKDWPILGDPSKYAAKLVLAAKFQNKYQAAHEALISRQDAELRLLENMKRCLTLRVKCDREYAIALNSVVLQAQVNSEW